MPLLKSDNTSSKVSLIIFCGVTISGFVLAPEYSPANTVVASVNTPPLANLGICGTCIVEIQLNGFTPNISEFFIFLNAEFNPLNGMLITLFIPLIIAFTIDFSPLNIPSFIPSNILQTVINTFLTACHA